MRNKDSKTTMFMYSLYECSAVEKYLENMAEKGWLLQSLKRGFFKFKKIEKTKIKYSVDVLDKVSVWDHENSDTALEYREYCEAAGWVYVCEDSKIQIFYTEEDKEVVSIHTDEGEKFKVIFKSSIYNVVGQIVISFLFGFMLYIQVGSYTETSFATNVGTALILLMVSFMSMNLIEIINFYIWVVKARGRLKKNKLMPYNSFKQVRRKNILMKTYNLIVVITFIIAIILDMPGSTKLNIPMGLIALIPMIVATSIRRFTNKKDYSKDSNMGIYIGSAIVSIVIMLVLSGIVLTNTNTNTNMKQSEVLLDRAKLTLSDFGYEKSEKEIYYIEFDKSPLANRTKYSSEDGYNSLEYTIFESKYPLLVRLQENSVLNRYKKYMHFKQEKTNLPSNIKVYFPGTSNFIVLVSQDKVIFIVRRLSVSSDEFLDIAYEKLLK